MTSTPNRPLRAISLFTGAGGLDLGFEAAGFETVACVERDQTARATLLHNRPEWNLLTETDVHRVTGDDLLAPSGLKPRNIDVLIGGPPCQPFSKAALWNSGGTLGMKDPRATTIGAMLDIASQILPAAIVIENVRGFAQSGKGEALALVRRRLGMINRRHGTKYRATVSILSATSFGVPQFRERAFIVALRDGQTFVPPTPTHGEGLIPFATAWDALGDESPTAAESEALRPAGKWAELLPTIPEGSNYLHHTSRGAGMALFGWRTRYWSFLLKLSKAAPSWTLQAAPGPATGPFHWDNRLLSTRELCELQTFPACYEVLGSALAVRRQMGNAVPSALAEAVAGRVRAAITGERPSGMSSLAVASRAGMPLPTTPAEVPERYRHLVGDHAEHPGHGKGPGALRRQAPVTASGRDDLVVGNQHPDTGPLDFEFEDLVAA